MPILSRLFNWRPAADIVIFQIDPDSNKKIYASIETPIECSAYPQINWVTDPAKASRFRSEAKAAELFRSSDNSLGPKPEVLEFARLPRLTS